MPLTEPTEIHRPSCPHCGHNKAWRNGHRNGLQRWLCVRCGREYVKPGLTNPLNRAEPYLLLAAAGEKQAERLVGVQNGTEKKGGKMEKCEDVQNSDLLKAFSSDLKAKILAFAVKRENQGYKNTQKTVWLLRRLIEFGADLYDPETVKKAIAKMPVEEGSKRVYCDLYEAFLRFLGGTWEKPNYKVQSKIPFIPMETEIDQLIASFSRRLATFCQILKQTAAREGEATNLKWTDIDFERRTITINKPEKGSLPRIIKVSEKCISMISQLPKKSEKLFSNNKSMARLFSLQRKRAATKLNNPRLKEIRFHTFRHWKATMEYHKTHDIFYVKDLLGHKNIQNTMIYVTIERAIFQYSADDEFTVKVARTIDEAVKLLEVGFEYVTDMDEVKLFRKRK